MISLFVGELLFGRVGGTCVVRSGLVLGCSLLEL